MTTLPHGSWPSPLSAADVVAAGSVPTALHAESGTVWWSETRPDQGGREGIVRRDSDGTQHDVLPEGFSARSAVHEYGGGAWWVHAGTVFAVSWDDQRLYRVEPGTDPLPITPEPAEPRAWRYADGRATPDGRWLVCVRERHEGTTAAEVRNELVALPTDGSAPPRVLFSGSDFVAAPRISRDGRQLAWLAWNHPHMPWDATELWLGRLAEEGAGLTLHGARREAGGHDEALVQPEWGRHATLYVSSDRSDWWNVHEVRGVDRLRPIAPVAADVSVPPWVFGQSRYVVMTDGTVVSAHADGRDTVLTFTPEDGPARTTRLPEQHVRSIVADGDRLLGIVALPTGPPEVRALLQAQVLRPGSGPVLPEPWVSVPTQVSFPTGQAGTAHAWFYPPTNPDVSPAPGTRPPLLVQVHGGPTSSAHPEFSPAVQYWTTRGFAVADVDYRGSSGYGRAYRALLAGSWGVVDVEDATAAARHLAATGAVDPARMAIRGGSAGGLTALLATLRGAQFAAAVSHYGVMDLLALAAHTHKFESRYLDGLVGPLPQDEEVYRQRSPITHVAHAHTPTLVLQGALDAVVPPEQAEAIVAALVAQQVPHAYIVFPDERHGFRQAANQITALTTELAFYAAVLGFEPADPTPPLVIRFADRLAGRTTAP